MRIDNRPSPKAFLGMSGTSSFEWIFVVEEVAAPDDPRIDALYDHVDALVESHSGLPLVTTLTSGESATQAAREALLAIHTAGFTVRRSYPDFVTRAEIADRVGRTRSAVDNWVRGVRQKDFPTPAHLAGGGLWLWRDVHGWVSANTHVDSDGVGYPSLKDHAQIDYELQAPGISRMSPIVLASAEKFGQWRVVREELKVGRARVVVNPRRTRGRLVGAR